MLPVQPLVTPRRGFLGRLAAASLALGVGGVLPARLRAESPDSPLDADDPDVERWLDGVKGRHRQVFDAVTPNDGLALAFAMVFLNSNNEANRLKDDALNAVVVLRHTAIPIALTDPIWAKYELGKAFGIKDPKTNEPATRNPYYHPRAGDLHFPDMAVEKLQRRGVIFGVCNVALTVLSGMRAKEAGTTPEAAKAEWTAGIIPGMTIVPAGVWAVNRAQEHRCTYCYAG